MSKIFCVYMMSNKWRGTIYTGLTSGLPKRTYQHKTQAVAGFTSKYKLSRLVYHEVHASAVEAARREKQIKEWKRDWKIRLIEEKNPEWRDLYAEICQ